MIGVEASETLLVGTHLGKMVLGGIRQVAEHDLRTSKQVALLHDISFNLNTVLTIFIYLFL